MKRVQGLILDTIAIYKQCILQPSAQQIGMIAQSLMKQRYRLKMATVQGYNKPSQPDPIFSTIHLYLSRPCGCTKIRFTTAPKLGDPYELIMQQKRHCS
jgi:hypothetical protein